MTTRSSYMTLSSKDMPKEYPITRGRQGMKARNGSSPTTEFTTHKSLAKFVWFSIARQSPREILSMTSRWKIQISLTHTWASLVDSNRSVWQLWQTLKPFFIRWKFPIATVCFFAFCSGQTVTYHMLWQNIRWLFIFLALCRHQPVPTSPFGKWWMIMSSTSLVTWKIPSDTTFMSTNV